ncbi:MAG TPA: tryptophan-rich sensory protein [Blastocatellia bacterium]|nr:tryptophan-rich sensory protein [Blastocatellia bacterium]
MSAIQQALGLLVITGICFAVAGIGSWFMPAALSGWFITLNKPSWNPPNWVFGPVWSMLYLFMAIAAWLVWRQLGWSGAVVPLALFAMQLLLNGAWTGLFFGLRKPWIAFAEIVLLWCAILATLFSFWRVKPLAGWMLVPYLLWVTFAAVLNLTLARMNP